MPALPPHPDLDAVAAGDAGGVPGGSALLHAAVFGMTDVLDVLVAAGARVRSIEEAAAAGDLADWLSDDTPPQALVRALVMAADHQRLDVIDALVAARSRAAGGHHGRRGSPSTRGPDKPAPSELGGGGLSPLADAPGTYVHQT